MHPEDQVYTDLLYAARQQRRTSTLIRVSLWVVGTTALVNLWLTSVPSGAVGWAIIDAAVAIGALLLLAKRSGLTQATTIHVTYWLVFAYIWSAQLLGEGLTAPHAAAMHFWFITLCIVSLLIFSDGTKILLSIYVFLPLLSFVLCEFALVRSAPNIALAAETRALVGGVNATAAMVSCVIVAYVFSVEVAQAQTLLRSSNEKLEQLISNMLPRAISERLRKEGRTFADGYAECSVLFADLVGFTPLSSSASPADIVRLLDEIFSRFDNLTDKHGLEKIKTIGDAYMVAAGLPEPREDHALALTRLALEMRSVIREYAGLELRIGINSGAVVAGIIGQKRFIYDLWGDTVNIASRMESQGVADEIQVSGATNAAIESEFETVSRGEIEVKGKGRMEVHLVVGRRLAVDSTASATENDAERAW